MEILPTSSIWEFHQWLQRKKYEARSLWELCKTRSLTCMEKLIRRDWDGQGVGNLLGQGQAMFSCHGLLFATWPALQAADPHFPQPRMPKPPAFTLAANPYPQQMERGKFPRLPGLDLQELDLTSLQARSGLWAVSCWPLFLGMNKDRSFIHYIFEEMIMGLIVISSHSKKLLTPQEVSRKSAEELK